jgi:hypothetical protein
MIPTTPDGALNATTAVSERCKTVPFWETQKILENLREKCGNSIHIPTTKSRFLRGIFSAATTRRTYFDRKYSKATLKMANICIRNASALTNMRILSLFIRYLIRFTIQKMKAKDKMSLKFYENTNQNKLK